VRRTIHATGSRHHRKQAKQIPICFRHAVILRARALDHKPARTNEAAGQVSASDDILGGLFNIAISFNKIVMASSARRQNMPIFNIENNEHLRWQS
jgi:hypothetical protein